MLNGVFNMCGRVSIDCASDVWYDLKIHYEYGYPLQSHTQSYSLSY